MDGPLFPAQGLVTLDAMREARALLPDVIRHTPLIPLSRDSAEVGKETLFLKCDNLQVTGAFKVRAVFNVMRHLSSEQKAKGVVLASSGNFAQGFAFAGKTLGVPICVVMLDQTSPYKIEMTQGYGAEVYLCGDDALARQSIVEKLGKDRGMTAIDTWEEPPIIEGHGSIGLEIMDDIVLISEDDIARAFRTLLFRAKVLAEPSGAVAAAGFLSGKVDQSLKTVAAVTGGNLTVETMNKLMAMSAD